MFEVGFSELALLFVVALLVVGPERLPGLARTLGAWVGKIRRMAAEVRGELEREMKVEEVKQAIRQHDELADLKKLAARVQTINTDVQNAIHDVNPAPGAAAPAVPPAANPPPPPPAK